jgi:hypothetical protein
LLRGLVLVLAIFAIAQPEPLTAQRVAADEFDDSHFHLTNYM